MKNKKSNLAKTIANIKQLNLNERNNSQKIISKPPIKKNIKRTIEYSSSMNMIEKRNCGKPKLSKTQNNSIHKI